jgi:prolyl oligopeptidase
MPSRIDTPAPESNDPTGEPIDDPVDDPFLWLEDVLGEPALAWVRERNAEAEAVLTARLEYAPIRAELLEVMNSKARIPSVSRRGDFFYNLWQDAAHKRGRWRRTTLESYKTPEPDWETVLDLDALAAAEGENWVWGGATGLAPWHHRVLISLSRGGADAAVVREFDTVAKAFVADGFVLPEAKSSVEWVDADTLFVGTDTGPGSMSASGYPRTVRRWSRGSALTDAPVMFEVGADDMSAHASVDAARGHERTFFIRVIDFYRREYFLHTPTGLQRIDLPDDASIAFWNSADDPADTLLIELRSNWQVDGQAFAQGTLLATDALAYLGSARRFDALFTPTATCSLAGYTTTRTHLILNLLDNVASRLEAWQRGAQGFTRRAIEAPSPGTLVAAGLHDSMRAGDPLAENYLLSYSDFLTPDTLWLASTASDARETLKSQPAHFDAGGMRVEQAFATSADGTRVPYFIVWPRGVDADSPADGSTPTLLYGYGGFEVSMQPGYRAGWGRAWLARGGVLVIANIRGGGEFGPAWHQAALKANRQRCFDDFIAVAEALISRRITSPRHLGIEGGSNGGLLVGATFTQRPELFNAVVCSVPLLDMKRYHRLLAGASWMAEYGNPDLPDEWASLSAYSPYQNVKADSRYPEVLFTTSTRDDRVHPGHARKMAAKMRAQGHPVLYWENIEGGHGGAADNEQRAHMQALELAYLWRQLSPPTAPPSTA